MPSGRPVVLTLLGCYWPGHEATGPNQSFNGLVAALGGEFEFKVVGLARAGAPGLKVPATGTWLDDGKRSVRYVTGQGAGYRDLLSILRETPHDMLVLNGFFDHQLTIPALLARKLGAVPRRPTILSPRGEFSAGEAALKKAHKRAYLQLVRMLRLLDGVSMHATAESEAEDIRRHCPSVGEVVVASNIRVLDAMAAPPRIESAVGRALRLVFLSRIDRKKNLDYAIKVIAGLGVPVSLDIYGPVSDEAYWAECQELMAWAPADVAISYKGAIANAEVGATLAHYDAFVLPTAGENFGHAILDALAAGVPVLISDRTPWLDLERRGAGWSLPLERPEAFAAAMRMLKGMSTEERQRLSAGARSLAEQAVRQSGAVERNRAMLIAAIGGQHRSPELAAG